MRNSASRRHRRAVIAGYAAVAALTLGALELATYTVSRVFLLERIPFLLYEPPRIDRRQWRDYLQERDPLLGWPSRQALSSTDYDRSGSRPVPAFPAPGDECVTLYGDSYTYGSDVTDDEAWGNVLSDRLGCRVGNFGVGGYGTDQALLRFVANGADRAAVSILGLFAANMMRNVNQYRDLRTGDSPLGFKPRFIVEGDSLRLIPRPEPTYAELRQLDGDIGRLLPHEAFEPGTPVGPVPFEFPYTRSLVRLLLHDQVINWLLDRPSWINFVDAGHPSRALQVTVAICSRFIGECEARDKRCFVLLFPTPSSYELYVDTGALAMAPLMAELESRAIPHLDLTAPLARLLAERDYAEILTNRPQPGMGHFNAAGNGMVAGLVLDRLRADYGFPGE